MLNTSLSDSQLLDLKEKAEKAKRYVVNDHRGYHDVQALRLACTPSTISTLVDEIVELRKDIDTLYKSACRATKDRDVLSSQLAALQAGGEDDKTV